MGEPKGQREFLRLLLRSRAAAFRGEIVPHLRYVFQSGFGLFLSAVAFTALISYMNLIEDVPADWPAGAVGVFALTTAMIRAPLRTYLRPADIVFLLAMEKPIFREYVGSALHKAIIVGAIRTLALFAIYAPIYSHAEDTAVYAESRPLAGLAIVLAVIAGCNVYSGWRERRFAAAGWRQGIRLIRWTLTGLVVAALLFKPFGIALLWMSACVVLMALLWRLPRLHALPWERLVAEEDVSRGRWMSFLSWFVDVRMETSKPARRNWIAWVGDLLKWEQRWSWHFLVVKTFLRSETFGALLRWTVLSGAILVVSTNVVADAVIYGVSMLIIGLQLSELSRVRFVETAATLPIAPEGRLIAAAAIARSVGIAAALILVVVAVFESGASAQWDIWLSMLVVGLLWTAWWMPRKIVRQDDEEEI